MKLSRKILSTAIFALFCTIHCDAYAASSRVCRLSVKGQGYVALAQPDGSLAYTREGVVSLTQYAGLVMHGLPIQGPGIFGTAQQTKISENGFVTAIMSDETERVLFGQILLYRFSAPKNLVIIRKDVLRESGRSGPPTIGQPGKAGFGRISCK